MLLFLPSGDNEPQQQDVAVEEEEEEEEEIVAEQAANELPRVLPLLRNLGRQQQRQRLAEMGLTLPPLLC